MANTVRITATATDQASPTLTKVKGSVDQVGTSAGAATGPLGRMTGAFGGMKGAIAPLMGPLGIVGVGLAMKGTIDAASDLGEQMSKSNVVFGDSADEIEAWSRTTAKGFGISQREALAAVGTFGNLFQAMGLGQKPAADMSQKLIELAADLASFNNASPEEVLLAMRSGMVGQVEPMRKFGVELSATAIAAKAAELGLGGVGRELTQGEKIQARYAIMVDQTSLAQGDFARTSDSLANSQRIMNAELENASAEIGQELLPAMTELVHFITDTAIPTFKSFTDEAKFSDGMEDAYDSLGLGGIEDAIDKLWATIGVTAASGQKTVSNDLSRTIETFEDGSKKIRANVINDFLGLPKGMSGALYAGLPKVTDAMDDIGEAAQDSWKLGTIKIVKEAKETPEEIADGLRSGYDDVKQGMADLVEALKNPISDAKRIAYLEAVLTSKAVKEGLASEDSAIRYETIARVNQVIEELARLKGAAAEGGHDSMMAFAAAIRASHPYIKDAVGDALEAARMQLQGQSPPPEGPLKDIDKDGENLMRTLADGIRKGEGPVRDAVKRVMSEARRNIQNARMDMRDSIEDIWDSIRDFFRPEESDFARMVRETGEQFADLRKSIMRDTSLTPEQRERLIAQLNRAEDKAIAFLHNQTGGEPTLDPELAAYASGQGPVQTPSAGVPLVVQFNSVVPYTPAQMRAAAEAFGPELIRYLRTQGFAPRPGFSF